MLIKTSYINSRRRAKEFYSGCVVKTYTFKSPNINGQPDNRAKLVKYYLYCPYFVVALSYISLVNTLSISLYHGPADLGLLALSADS